MFGWLCIAVSFSMMLGIGIVDLVRRFRSREQYPSQYNQAIASRWQMIKWKYASDSDVRRELAPREHELWELQPLADCLLHPEWWEINERMATDDEIEVLYDDTPDVPEESAVQYRVFQRLGRYGLARCRHVVRYPFLRVRR
jgi:hypothetical protein